MRDLIERQAAIDVLGVFTQADALGHTPKQIVEALPSVQPKPIWGLHASTGRPLGDLEIVPRLREIQKQIGGSYAIDRAVEVIEAIAERGTDECTD